MMKFHPFSEFFPLMTGDELAELGRSIVQEGLLEPIWTLDGEIIDGRNRYRACLAVGVTPKFREWSGNSPLQFVICQNLQRRHLNSSQRGMIAARMIPLIEAETRERMKMGKTLASDDARGKASGVAAKAMNVGQATVERAKVALKAEPEVQEEVMAGRKTVTAAARLAAMTPAEQVEAIRKAESRPPRDARNLRIDRGQHFLRKALKLFEGLGGDEGEPVNKWIRKALAASEEL